MVSCNKAQQPDDNQGIKVNITVGSLEQPTKAVKTEWNEGDIINVYLNDKRNYAPDFTLTRVGSQWKASELSATTITALEANPNGTIKGFWEQTNGTGAWNKYSYYWDSPDADKGDTSGIVDYLVALFGDISYSYSGGTLTANIDSWSFRTNIQIVVTGIVYESGKYTLYSDAINNISDIRINVSNVSNGYHATGSAMGRIAGISNADGVAFVGGINSDTSSSQSVTLHLLDNVAGKHYSFTKPDAVLYSAGKTKICAIKVPFSSFSEI